MKTHGKKTNVPAAKRSRWPERPVPRPTVTALRFTPCAWAKLVWMRDRGDTEIGGFGVSAADDLLLMEDFATVEQDAGPCHVHFDDESVADHLDVQVDAGRKPEQVLRCWLHTHPGDSPAPSGTDEETFARVFGACDWAVMFILAKGGRTYARLRFGAGPGGQMEIPVDVAWEQPFEGSDRAAWEAEYVANIQVEDTDWFGWDQTWDVPDGRGEVWPHGQDMEEFNQQLAVAGYSDDPLWPEEE